MSPSAFSILGPQGGGGGGQTWTKIFLGQVGMCVQNFIKLGAGVWISISPPHTNRQTNRHTSVIINPGLTTFDPGLPNNYYIYIYILVLSNLVQFTQKLIEDKDLAFFMSLEV